MGYTSQFSVIQHEQQMAAASPVCSSTTQAPPQRAGPGVCCTAKGTVYWVHPHLQWFLRLGAAGAAAAGVLGAHHQLQECRQQRSGRHRCRERTCTQKAGHMFDNRWTRTHSNSTAMHASAYTAVRLHACILRSVAFTLRHHHPSTNKTNLLGCAACSCSRVTASR